MKKLLGLTVITVLLSCLTACNGVYKKVTNVVDNYEYLHIVLREKETITLDIQDIFKDSGINISHYEIKCSNPDIVKIRKNIITPTASGSETLSIVLYENVSQTKYLTTFANIYTIIEKDFVKISTTADLIGLQSKRIGNYILTNDIDLAGVDWEPIGNYPAKNQFTGMFVNLNDYKIKNLTITSSNNVFKGPYGGCLGGLFGSSSKSFFYGLNLVNVNIDLSDFTPEFSGSSVGGIVGISLSDTFFNCKVQGTLSSTSETGGIAGGSSWSRFIGCEFTGSIVNSASKRGQNGAGGICGVAGGGRIVDCNVNATISSTVTAGLLAGWCETFGGLYKNNTYSGNIDASECYSLEFGAYFEKGSLDNKN